MVPGTASVVTGAVVTTEEVVLSDGRLELEDNSVVRTRSVVEAKVVGKEDVASVVAVVVAEIFEVDFGAAVVAKVVVAY